MNGQDEFGRDPASPGSSATGVPVSGTVPPTAAPPYGYTGAPGYTGAAGYTGAPGDYGFPPPSPYGAPPVPGLPNPATAVLLGFIPGVGAMYNGQFAKGIANIAIFAIFVSLANHASEIFGIFVAGWIAFMVFDAYQTARARRFGLPLPNAFGLNDIGERLGFGSNTGWRGAETAAPPQPPQPATESYRVDPHGNVYAHRASGAWPQTASTDPRTGGAPYTPNPQTSGAPYTPDPQTEVYGSSMPASDPSVPFGSAGRGFASAEPASIPYGQPAAPPPPNWVGVPPNWTGAPPNWAGAPPGFDPPASGRPRSALASVPAGALWLIGFGIFALLGSLHRFYFFHGELTGGLFLLAISVFLFIRRWQVTSDFYPDGTARHRWAVIQSLRGAGLFLVAGILTLLQAVRVVRWENSWPFLLIFLGVWILIERIAYNRMARDLYAPPLYPAATNGSEPAQGDRPSVVPSTSSPINDQEGR